MEQREEKGKTWHDQIKEENISQEHQKEFVVLMQMPVNNIDTDFQLVKASVCTLNCI